MLSYQFYKVIHLWSIFILLIALVFGFIVKAPSKLTKITIGLTTFLIFVAGMGMMARLGISHTEGWPVWIYVKVVLWLLVSAAAPILMKRLIRFRMTSLYLCVFFIMAAAWVAINQGLFVY